jgi:hypothetical protein
MGDQAKIKKERFDGTQVEILGETYDPGQTSIGEKYNWEERLGGDQKDLMMFLKTGLRYWYSKDWFGSEKRKNPA